MDDRFLGDRVQRLREKRSLTHVGLAAKLGVGEGAIRKIEEGATKQPKFSNGIRIAAALGVWPDEIAFETPMRSDLTVLIDGIQVEVRLRLDTPLDAARQRRIAAFIEEAVLNKTSNGLLAEQETQTLEDRVRLLQNELHRLNERIADALEEISRLKMSHDGREFGT